ncbi:MAG: SagB/ThcOx family dehydrogenase [Candidatus Fermentibacteraceae bacterium]|nr:SagB/ThcOx family dehydrogenase [Candidatus Fermentibacteraceae bacterium]
MEGRDFLKANWHLLDSFQSDQMKGVEHPEIQKPVPEGAIVIELPELKPDRYPDATFQLVMDSRRSLRKYTLQPVSLEELSFLLWSTQGVQKVVRDGVATLRTVPSAGARHPFETYLLVNDVSGLDPGCYRYLPIGHSLVLLGDRISPEKVIAGCHGQSFCGECAVTFVWSVIPYRTEWRYGPVSHKVIALDAGHVCQNLYLACTAAGLGTCGIGAYDQEAMDSLMDFDGKNEFTIYIAPVGAR